jgi:CHAD domain-containing protein
MRDVYRRGRKLQQALARDPSSENSHGLRRQAKYLWYQLRMLEKQVPEDVQAVIAELDGLGEMLGEDNDMAVLTETLRANPEICGNSVRAELIYSLAETRRIALLSAGLRISQRIYARKPGRFTGDVFPET